MNSKFRGRGRGRGRGGHFYARSFMRTGPKPKLDQAAVVDTRFVVQRLSETSSSRGGDGQAGTTWNHPPTQTHRFYQRHQFPQDCRYFCDRCFRGYDTQHFFNIHIQNHVKCTVEGCKFEGLPRIVAKHVLSLHAYNVPLPQEITKISADKWIEARKRNFPTPKSVESKQQKVEARIDRGEVLETQNDFGKFKMVSLGSGSDKNQVEKQAAVSFSNDDASDKDQLSTNRLIEKLLATEIRHERNVLLQCIRYITTHDKEFGIDKK